MRKITFRSIDGQDEVDVIDAALTFKNGETGQVTDEQAEILLRNPNFVDAETGKNPNYSCASCGKETRVAALWEPGRMSPTRGPHTLTIVDGKRYCPEHLDAASAPSVKPEGGAIAEMAADKGALVETHEEA